MNRTFTQDSALESLTSLPKLKKGTLRILPFGGCGEFGMNTTIYECDNKRFVVDAGIMFPDPNKLGVDGILPQLSPWLDDSGVSAYLMTHGHEDHIGALPHMIRRWPAPIYATQWTAKLIEAKFENRGLQGEFPITVVEPGESVKLPGLQVDWHYVNHSIPMACGLMIQGAGRTVFHTGDFKIDESPLYDEPMDLSALSRTQGIDLLIADSTNAMKPGHCPSEASVMEPLERTVRAGTGATVVTTFASNLWRLMSIAEICRRLKRKLYVVGNGVENVYGLAEKLGIYDIPDGLRVEGPDLKRLSPQQIVVLATGSQGERMSGLRRIVHQDERYFSLQPEDQIVFSSRIVPGNEKSILDVMDRANQLGARTISTREAPEIHVSGHAYQGEIASLLRYLRPRYFVPMHGTYSHMEANAGHVSRMPTDSPKTRLMRNGDVFELDDRGLRRVGKIDIDYGYVDAVSRSVIDHATLRQRLRIGERGVAFLSGVTDATYQNWKGEPQLQLLGFHLPTTIDESGWRRQLLTKILAGLREEGENLADQDARNEIARLTLRRALTETIQSKPVVIAQIHLES